MKLRLAIIVLFLLTQACQVIPRPPESEVTPNPTITQTLVETLEPEAVEATATLAAEPPTETPESLAPSQLLPVPPRRQGEFALVEHAAWNPQPARGGVQLPIALEDVRNQSIVTGLTNSQRKALSENGFVVVRTLNEQFASIRHRVSNRYGQPYFLTTDAAFHAMHLTQEELLLALDREEMRPRLLAILQATLAEIFSFIDAVKGTPLEEEVRTAAAYLAVGLRLLDPLSELHPSLEYRVRIQVEQIIAARGIEASVLFPEFKDDFRLYTPVGRYANTPEMGNYYQAMLWFQRVSFPLESATPGFEPRRLPLIVTLGLRRAMIEDMPAWREWAELDDVLAFLDGPTYNDSPREYGVLMDQVYGNPMSVVDLVDPALWQSYLNLGHGLPAQPIDLALLPLPGLEQERTWRLFPHRFPVDEFILQNLIYDRVGAAEKPRLLPSGLDLMATLDSQPAISALSSAGALNFQNYASQLGGLQSGAQARSSEQWRSTLFGSWLYAFLPQLQQKNGSFFPFMRTEAWGYKDLGTALGSWAELKHSAPVVIVERAEPNEARPPLSPVPPAFVEPNPEVFYRLAHIAGVLADGLESRGMGGREEDQAQETSLYRVVADLRNLSMRLRQLGVIAEKELQGRSLGADDYAIIQAPLGAAEERAFSQLLANPSTATLPAFLEPLPVVGMIVGAQGRVLQVATGLVNRIYVIVPLDGSLYIAQGGVYSYYEFAQTGSAVTTDTIWRQVLKGSLPVLPAWSSQFVTEGGTPQDQILFRIGDVYRISSTGVVLNLRASPSISAVVLRTLRTGDYLTIVGGPQEVEEAVWWKFRLNLTGTQVLEGWLMQNPTWFERAWGQ